MCGKIGNILWPIFLLMVLICINMIHNKPKGFFKSTGKTN